MSRSLRKTQIPTNLIFPLAQTAIPCGYTSETFGYSLKNVDNNSTNPGTTYTGSHTHPATATHTHAAKSISHKHSYCTTAAGCTSPPTFNVGFNTGTAVESVGLHKHSEYTSETAVTLSQSTASASHSHDANTFEPQYYSYTHMRKNSTISFRQSNKVPFNAIVFASSSSLFPGYTLDTAGSGKTVGEGTLGVIGGSTTHEHLSSGITAHSHLADIPSHTHTISGSSGGASATNTESEQGSTHSRTPAHVHTASGTTAATSVSSVPLASGDTHTESAITHEPANIILGAAKHISVGLRHLGVPQTGVVEWRCTLGSIPTGFGLTDGSGGRYNYLGKAIKIAANTGEISNTSGSTSHQHPAQTHTHTIAFDASHLHTASIATGSASVNCSPGVSAGNYSSNIQTSHTHNINTTNLEVLSGACNTPGFSTTSACGTHQHNSATIHGRSIDIALIQKT